MQRIEAEIERLREAIIRAPCTQHSIPCGWPCDSEIPCWKQIVLGSHSKTMERARAVENVIKWAGEMRRESGTYRTRAYESLEKALDDLDALKKEEKEDA